MTNEPSKAVSLEATKANGDMRVSIPLTEFVRETARDAGRAGAREVMTEFAEYRLGTCPQHPRIARLEVAMSVLVLVLMAMGVLRGFGVL